MSVCGFVIRSYDIPWIFLHYLQSTYFGARLLWAESPDFHCELVQNYWMHTIYNFLEFEEYKDEEKIVSV